MRRRHRAPVAGIYVPGRHRASSRGRRPTAMVVSLVLVASTMVVGVLAINTTSASAAASPSQAWATTLSAGSPTGGTGTPVIGETRTWGYSNGVTAAEKITALSPLFPASNFCTWDNVGTVPFGVALGQANVLQAYSPTPPTNATTAEEGCGKSASETVSYTYSQTVINPILHVKLNASASITIAGTTTTGAPITLTTVRKAPGLTVTGNVINPSPVVDTTPNTGCEAQDGTNGNTECASIQLNGPISTFSFMLNAPLTTNGGAAIFLWSFPTATLTKTFTPTSIPVGGTSALTFSIASPNDEAQSTLTPLDFTDVLPSGVTIANTTVTNNGSCGTPVVANNLGAALAVGSAGVGATKITVAPGTTCTITVNVTSSAVGSYLNTTANMGTTIANLTLSPNATLTVTTPPPPTLTITKVSVGGVGGFSFTGTNGYPGQTITTTSSGVGVAAPTVSLTAPGVATTITETGPPAGYVVAASCTGLGSGTATLAGNVLTLNAAATAAGNAIFCTFTNTKNPTLTITKVSFGGTGAFVFTGTNGYPGQTIITTVDGTPVTAATVSLSTAGVATAITEALTPGYKLTTSCTGLGSGTATQAANVLTLNAAAMAAGNNVACTFTNTLSPTITITKVSVGGVGVFSFTGTNGYPGQTIVTTASGLGVSAPTVTLASASVATTITEAGPPAGYTLSVSCTGIGTGTATLAGNVLTLNPAATLAGHAIACTFTNTTVASLSTSKVLTSINGVAATAGQAVLAGDVLVYTITTTNSGATAASTVLTETTPAGTTHTSGTEGWTGTGPYTRTVTAPASGSAAPVTFTATVSNPAGVTSISNTVTSTVGSCSSCTPTPDPVTAYTVAKSSSLAPGATIAAGQSLTYTISVTNTGAGTGTASVTDPVPTTVSVSTVTCTTSAGSSCTAGPQTNAVSGTVTLLASGTASYVIAGIVNAAGSLTNTATVTADHPRLHHPVRWWHRDHADHPEHRLGRPVGDQDPGPGHDHRGRPDHLPGPDDQRRAECRGRRRHRRPGLDRDRESGRHARPGRGRLDLHDPGEHRRRPGVALAGPRPVHGRRLPEGRRV